MSFRQMLLLMFGLVSSLVGCSGPVSKGPTDEPESSAPTETTPTECIGANEDGQPNNSIETASWRNSFPVTGCTVGDDRDFWRWSPPYLLSPTLVTVRWLSPTGQRLIGDVNVTERTGNERPGASASYAFLSWRVDSSGEPLSVSFVGTAAHDYLLSSPFNYVGEYRIELEQKIVDPQIYEHSDTREEATIFWSPGEINGHARKPLTAGSKFEGEVDYFAFEMLQEGDLRVELKGPYLTEIYVDLERENGERLGSSGITQSENGDIHLLTKTIPAGKYYLRVELLESKSQRIAQHPDSMTEKELLDYLLAPYSLKVTW